MGGSLVERFDPSARDVLVRAGLEARWLGRPAIDTEHLLLALAEDEGSATGSVLALHGLTQASVLDQIRAEAAGEPVAVEAVVGFTPDVRDVLEIALLGRGAVTDRSLLLALALHGGGVAGRLLDEAGVTTQTLAAALSDGPLYLLPND